MMKIKNPGLWGLIVLTPTIFVLVLSLLFNDLSAGMLLVVMIGFAASGFFLFRARQMTHEALKRDNPSRRPERRRSARSGVSGN